MDNQSTRADDRSYPGPGQSPGKTSPSPAPEIPGFDPDKLLDNFGTSPLANYRKACFRAAHPEYFPQAAAGVGGSRNSFLKENSNGLGGTPDPPTPPAPLPPAPYDGGMLLPCCAEDADKIGAMVAWLKGRNISCINFLVRNYRYVQLLEAAEDFDRATGSYWMPRDPTGYYRSLLR